MSVTVPAVIVQAEERKASNRLASQARLKGFRKGRVPTKVIESRFGGSLRQEALDKLIGAAYKEALAARELRPISEGEIEDLQYKPEEDLTFAITFDVEPVFDVSTTSGFVIERPSQSVTDEQVEGVLERIQEQNGVWQPMEEGVPEEKDMVSVTITRLGDDGEAADEGRDYDLVVGSGDAIPDIEAAIRTLEPGKTGDFDISFPEDFPDEDRRGDSEKIRVVMKSRRERWTFLPWTTNWRNRSVSSKRWMNSQAKIREDMEKEASQQADAAVRGRLLDFVIDANPFEVPGSMVARYSDQIIGNPENVDAEKIAEFREQIRPEAERAVKRILVIERLAEIQSLQASDDDIDARIEEIAEANNTEPAKVYAELQKAGRLETMERELTENAVFEFLMGQSEITDAPEA